MYDYQRYINLFEEHLKKHQFDRKPTELYEPISYTLGLGGKRLRPILCLLGCEMFGEDPSKALNQALAIEFFHNFTLIHDDIMDNAPLRRGKKSVYKKWNNNIAILSGDTLFAFAYQYAQRVDNEIIHDVLCVFNSTAIEVCEGQQYDLNFENNNEITINDYLNMIRLKTAVLFGASLKIGAIIGGASDKDSQHLYDFGVNIGLGFQLRDDLLDTFGDESLFGKKTGGDILSNKKTYLYLKALETADNKQRKELISLYNTTQIDDQKKIQQVTSIFNALNIRQNTIEFIQNYYEKGMNCLNQINVEEAYKHNLTEIAQKMIDRKR